MKCRKFWCLVMFVASFDSIFFCDQGLGLFCFYLTMFSCADNRIRMSFMSLSRLELSAESLLQDTGRRDKMHSSGKLGPQKKGHTRTFILSLLHDQTATLYYLM